jgi:hypothetical protein
VKATWHLGQVIFLPMRMPRPLDFSGARQLGQVNRLACCMSECSRMGLGLGCDKGYQSAATHRQAETST